MQIIWFAVFLACLYFGTLIGFSFWIKKQDENVLVNRLPAGVGAFLFGALILGLAYCCAFFLKPSLAAYTWIVVVSFAILYCSARFESLKSKAIWMPLVCVAGTYALQKLVPGSIDLVYGGCVALVWMVVMGTVMFFDRLPLVNFLTLGTWAIAFTTLYVLSGFGSSEIATLGLLALAPLWALLNVLTHRMVGSFGPYASALLGFIMGGIVAMCLLTHSYGSVFMMTSYYLFEIFFFVLGLLGFHPLGMNRGQFALSVVLSKNNPVPVMRIVFFKLLIIALIAALVWQNNKNIFIYLIGIAVINWVDTYNRFKAGGAPAPGIRQMWQETKIQLKNLWQERGRLMENWTAPAKPDQKEKKAAPKKKTQAKKTTHVSPKKQNKKTSKGKKKK
ncbi:MAG: hypothetical protein II938_01320 [Alphaproteobacteria bacterium]|nr:hypothetical protein [Alphaproteobacteria bacterium]